MSSLAVLHIVLWWEMTELLLRHLLKNNSSHQVYCMEFNESACFKNIYINKFCMLHAYFTHATNLHFDFMLNICFSHWSVEDCDKILVENRFICIYNFRRRESGTWEGISHISHIPLWQYVAGKGILFLAQFQTKTLFKKEV